MRKIRILLSSFCVKVTLLLIFSIFFVMILSNLLIYQFSLNLQFNQIRDKLMVIAQTAALMVDADLLMQVPLNPEGINTVAFKTIAEKLNEIKKANPILKYVYTMAKTDREGILQFIVDPEPVTRVAKRKIITSYPGDTYNATNFPEMLDAFNRSSADKKLTVDEWGVVLSGYAPIRDRNAKTQALLGVDMAAEDVYAAQRQVHRRAFFVLVLGIFASIVLGFLISRRITGRIRRLVEGTRRIASDDLEYKVEVRGHDEISELASSFNNMAVNLFESKKKLQDYFYRVVQSLVRILEAKDAYTKGHSERVAGYACEIALSMGFSQEKSEMVTRVAQLHDIGKLVIHEEILNKKGKLTEEEWKIVKEHPIIGEDVLRPVLLNEEMLAIVRSHHERYDGEGYPDKIKGDNINIFAQIISVADAYDAMISRRAYRPPLSKEEAIEELKNNSGTQFNTQIVKAFLKVLQRNEKNREARDGN